MEKIKKESAVKGLDKKSLEYGFFDQTWGAIRQLAINHNITSLF